MENSSSFWINVEINHNGTQIKHSVGGFQKTFEQGMKELTDLLLAVRPFLNSISKSASVDNIDISTGTICSTSNISITEKSG